MTERSALERFRQKIGEKAWERLAIRLGQVNADVRTRGVRSLHGVSGSLAGQGTDLLTGYAYDEFYDWDLYFENIYLSYYGYHQYCRTNLEVFLDHQLNSGFVARTLIRPRQRQHFKPFLAQIALLGCRQSGSFEWLKWKYYERLKKYLAYWFWYQDFDKNGLCVWDSADHSGMDNQIRRAGEMDSLLVEGVDLNCYLVRELQAMAEIAAGMGLAEDQANFRDHASRLFALLNDTFWDDADGFYYDRHEREAKLIHVKSIAGFIPLWLGMVPPERAARLVEQRLHNPDEFWLNYPVATYARTEPDYYQERIADECNWCGPTWVPTNYMLFHGLVTHGFVALAEELAYKTFQMVLNEDNTREYFNAETGTGQGLNPFWGWSTLAYLMPLEFELDYDPTNIAQKAVMPIVTQHLKISLLYGSNPI